MKTKILILTFLSFCSFFLNAQTKFQKTYGALGYDAVYDIQKTPDGGYIIAGESSSFKDAAGDVYVIKTNAMGDTLWTKTYGVNGDYDYALAIRPTSDGGYVLCGNSAYDLIVIKTNATGDTLWTQKYGVAGNSAGFDIHQTAEGGYIIIGFTYLSNYDTYLIKIDALGNITWTKTYGGYVTATAQLMGNMIQQTSDGGYVFISQPGGSIIGSWDYTVVKTNSIGDTLWSKIYGGTNQDIAYSIKTTSDGGYIVAGYTDSFGAGGWDAYLIKLDPNGLVVWSKTYGGAGDDAATDVQQTTDGGYVFSGWTDSFGIGTYEAYAVKTNSTGDTTWTKSYGGISSLHVADAWSIEQANDGGFIMAGDIDDGTGNVDVYIIKTEDMGNSGCYESSTSTITTNVLTTAKNTPVQLNSANLFSNITFEMSGGGINSTFCWTSEIDEKFNLNSMISIYPNPFSESTMLEFENGIKNARIILTNSFGQVVMEKSNFTGNKIQINRSHLPSGIYSISVFDKEKIVSSGRLIIID